MLIKGHRYKSRSLFFNDQNKNVRALSHHERRPSKSKDRSAVNLDNMEIEPEFLTDVNDLLKGLGITESPKITKNINVGQMYVYNKDLPAFIPRKQKLTELLELSKVDTYTAKAVLKKLRKITISGLENRCTRVKTGNLFFCLPSHDSETIKKAVENGASAFVCDPKHFQKIRKELQTSFAIEVYDPIGSMSRLSAKFYDDPSKKISIFAVTGTKGKTVASWLIRGILEEMDTLTGLKCSVEFALGENILGENGVFWHPTQMDPTKNRECASPFHLTPYFDEKYHVPSSELNTLTLQQLIASFVDRGASSAVMSVSFRALDLLHQIDTDFVICTGSSKLDVDYPSYLESDIRALLKLIRSLHDPKKQRLILNVDDDFAENYAKASNNIPIITYSIHSRTADIYSAKIESSIFETNILVKTPLNLHLGISTPLIGTTNVYAILAAISTGIGFGASLETIINGVEAVDMVPGNREVIDEGQTFAVIVDSANTPEDFSELLDDMKHCKPSRVITVFGCCGENEKEKRASMGEIAHYKSDVVIISNDNPKGEEPGSIIKDIVAGWPDDILLRHAWFLFPWYQDIGRLPAWYTDQALWAQSEMRRYIIEDRYLAIRGAIYMACKNDIVVVAGKGHKDYQEWTHYNLAENMNKNDSQNNMKSSKVLGWFDDRVECRNALSKLPNLNEMFPGLDRNVLPWVWGGLNRRHPLEEWDAESSVATSNFKYPMS
jgi:UDP-N-acetylmuramyl tripeptide synthase